MAKNTANRSAAPIVQSLLSFRYLLSILLPFPFSQQARYDCCYALICMIRLAMEDCRPYMYIISCLPLQYVPFLYLFSPICLHVCRAKPLSMQICSYRKEKAAFNKAAFSSFVYHPKLSSVNISFVFPNSFVYPVFRGFTRLSFETSAQLLFCKNIFSSV